MTRNCFAPAVGVLLLSAAILLCFAPRTIAGEMISIGSAEDGETRTGQQEIWHDPENRYSVISAAQAYRNGEFSPLPGAGSTGLQKGAFWSHFILENPSANWVSINVEYVDHQLIELEAFARSTNGGGDFRKMARLSMGAPFEQRPVLHNRFVFPVEIAPGQAMELMVKFSSDEVGFVFPSMRIWSPGNLRASHTLETAIMAFLFGGFFLMSIFALVAAVTSRDRAFYAYSIYSLSKILAWGTILGFTHQYLIREDFHWRYMSVSGAVSIFCGLLFARTFLRTRRYTRKLDYVLLLMMGNAVLLAAGAALEIKLLALVTITLALLLYPVVAVTAVLRWRQGSREASIFALAWSLLVVSLVIQALRDVGLVEHNLFNYYLPPVASFTEMLTIMAAMGIRLQRMRLQKQDAERQYRAQLERSKTELEQLVCERTRALEAAKRQAEEEARTDPLTGVRNRRSFIADAEQRLKLARRNAQPVSLLMFDIDHFKSINDRHGHGIGDEALRSFSQTVIGKVRDTDIFGRIGGEEFGLLVSEGRDRALASAERLRDDIANISVQTSGGALQFTSSIGIAHSDDSCSLESLMNRADGALYEAKRRGRAIVVEYEGEALEVESEPVLA